MFYNYTQIPLKIEKQTKTIYFIKEQTIQIKPV